jgi:hypothetical protein
MTNNVLYYPYIHVPKSKWFLRVLLYWDNVGSIVPYEYLHRPELLGSYMRELVGEELVTQIIPGEYLHKIPNFSKVFIKSALKYKHKLEKNNISISRLPTRRIHIEKLNSIGDELCEMKLARPSEYPWYDVELKMADMFMAYLAGVLGHLPEINSTPITDSVQELNLYHSLETDRNIILDNILPAPEQSISPHELAQFKSKNNKHLTSFRNMIELFVIQLSLISDSNMREEAMNRFIDEAKHDISNIVDLMKENGWERVTLGRFLSYAAAGASFADALTSGGLISNIAAVFGIGSAIHTTYREAKISTILNDSYVAYAALANKALKV